MLERYFRSSRVRQRLRSSSILEHIERLVEYLHNRGHQRATIHQYVQATEHFGRWLSASRHNSLVITRRSVEIFLNRHLPACACALPASRSIKSARAALRHMLRAVSPDLGIEVVGKETPAEQLVREYVAHLDMNGGLALQTRQYRARYAREFLKALASRGGSLRLNGMTPQSVMRFVAGLASNRRRSSAQVAACSLRIFLRFLQMRGLCGNNIVQAVPRIPRWRQEGLPRTMTEEQRRRLLDSFDRCGATGRRDYAMTLYMVELGLRVSEVVALQLNDIDWRVRTVRIRSAKERRTRLLPLPDRVYRATASYLRRGRPSSPQRQVFLRHSVPVGIPVSRELVRGVIRRAYARSGCPHAWTGTHILRHTAATRLLQRGVSLKEIADLLGHQSIDTAAIYGKVNLPALAAVAMPWPEVPL